MTPNTFPERGLALLISATVSVLTGGGVVVVPLLLLLFDLEQEASTSSPIAAMDKGIFLTCIITLGFIKGDSGFPPDRFVRIFSFPRGCGRCGGPRRGNLF